MTFAGPGAVTGVPGDFWRLLNWKRTIKQEADAQSELITPTQINQYKSLKRFGNLFFVGAAAIHCFFYLAIEEQKIRGCKPSLKTAPSSAI